MDRSYCVLWQDTSSLLAHSGPRSKSRRLRGNAASPAVRISKRQNIRVDAEGMIPMEKALELLAGLHGIITDFQCPQLRLFDMSTTAQSSLNTSGCLWVNNDS